MDSPYQIKWKKDRPLRDYLNHFNKAKIYIADCDNNIAVHAFMRASSPIQNYIKN